MIGGVTLTQDQLGTPRPQAAAYDRGAFEFPVAPTAVTLTAVAATYPSAAFPVPFALILLATLTFVSLIQRQRSLIDGDR